MTACVSTLVAACLAATNACPPAVPPELAFSGAADASAAVFCDAASVLVADDENNVLRLYRIGSPGLPASTFDVSAHLGLATSKKKTPEADIEAATRRGNRAYWMTSHGRSKDGKRSPARERFFALSVNASSGQVGIVTEGNAYTALLSDLLASTNLAGLGLAEAAQPSLSKSKSLAPKAGGLNIEGLTVMPASSNLLIGFRNPVPHGRALLVPLLNPDDVIDRGAQARFGSPILLDLGGRGIRSIEYCPWRGDYLIAAGPVDEEEDFALYAWPGGQVRTAVRLPETVFIRGIKDFAPEALALDESTRRVFIATDDGSRDIPVASETECTVKTKNGACPNKSLADPRRKTFRALLPGLD